MEKKNADKFPMLPVILVFLTQFPPLSGNLVSRYSQYNTVRKILFVGVDFQSSDSFLVLARYL